MPCVNSRKEELREIAARFPDETARVAEWERIVSKVSKLGSATFFSAVMDPTVNSGDVISHDTHGIDRAIDWSRTARGGRQYDLLATDKQPAECSSMYGLCG
jgi:PhoPQ-activated pathogenicity-related protein